MKKWRKKAWLMIILWPAFSYYYFIITMIVCITYPEKRCLIFYIDPEGGEGRKKLLLMKRKIEYYCSYALSHAEDDFLLLSTEIILEKGDIQKWISCGDDATSWDITSRFPTWKYSYLHGFPYLSQSAKSDRSYLGVTLPWMYNVCGIVNTKCKTQRRSFF